MEIWTYSWTAKLASSWKKFWGYPSTWRTGPPQKPLDGFDHLNDEDQNIFHRWAGEHDLFFMLSDENYIHFDAVCENPVKMREQLGELFEQFMST